MGKITLTVEGSTVGTVAGGGGIVISSTVSEQDSGRLIAAYAQTYAHQFTNPDGTPRQPSIQEVLEAWWAGVVSVSVTNVLNVEKEQAAVNAANAVQEISVT